jgi:hypothetical protein
VIAVMGFCGFAAALGSAFRHWLFRFHAFGTPPMPGFCCSLADWRCVLPACIAGRVGSSSPITIRKCWRERWS